MINKECQQIVKPDGSKQLQAIPDTAADGIITTDKHGIVRSFNVAAEQIFGYTSKEIIGKNIKILMAKPFQGQHDDFLENSTRTIPRSPQLTSIKYYPFKEGLDTDY